MKSAFFVAPYNSPTIRRNLLPPCSRSKSKQRKKIRRSGQKEDGFACRNAPFKDHSITSVGCYCLLLTPLQIISLVSLVLPQYLLVIYMLFTLLTTCPFLLSLLSDPENSRSTFLRNVGEQVPHCITLPPRRWYAVV
jgi:hypothetical protein